MSAGEASPKTFTVKIEAECEGCGGMIFATLRRDAKTLFPWYHGATSKKECGA